MSNSHVNPAFDLDGLVRSIIGANEAEARAYQRIQAPFRPDVEVIAGRDDLAALDEMGGEMVQAVSGDEE